MLVQEKIEEVQNALVEAGYFDKRVFDGPPATSEKTALPAVSRIERELRAAREAQEELLHISRFLRSTVVDNVLAMDRRMVDPSGWARLRALMERILFAVEDFRTEPGFVAAYADLFAVYLFVLYRQGSPGRESPLIRLMLTNIARRKAVELNQTEVLDTIGRLDGHVTIALIAKRYAVYILVTQGLTVLTRAEIDFRSHGMSPEGLALQISNILVRSGVRLGQVSDIVCAGGDVGTLPDGIYVLDTAILDASKKRLEASSLNRGALISWELRKLLQQQVGDGDLHVSLASPLSFTTLDPLSMGSFLRAESRELQQSLKGYVKVTPLKSLAALVSETHRISQGNLNMVVMSLDELHASVVRKTGPRIARELARQDANDVLAAFDFSKILEALHNEHFELPSHFGLASPEVGTGVKEICELMMILESGKISTKLAGELKRVVDTYARQVAMIMEMASAGDPSERPHFVAIASMLALNPYFQKLFAKIRYRIDNPYTPIMCVDSLEHEYLVANHLFEMHLHPGREDTRLRFAVESNSMSQALRVLESPAAQERIFSFSTLFDRVSSAIHQGELEPGKMVLVGAENEDALEAAATAKQYGLVRELVLIGAPEEIVDSIERAKILLDPKTDPTVRILSIDPLATDYESKKNSVAQAFGEFLTENPDFMVMKGSISTAPLLKRALAIYKSQADAAGSSEHTKRKIASHTALFVFPDGRFFALSDPAVNPGFHSARDLLQVIENQVEIVRKVVHPKVQLRVAIITAVEKETAAIPATHLAAETEELSHELEERYGPIIVEGPLSFDLATVPEVAEEKHYGGDIRGDANCLVATNINTANVLYKMLSKTMGSLGIMIEAGSIITAGPGTVPIVLNSRGDTAGTKFNSILLALSYCSGARCTLTEP